MTWKPQHPAFRALVEAMLGETTPVFIVGGVVRDSLMGRTEKTTDLDLAVYENAIRISRTVADRLGWAFYPMDDVHDVGRLIFMATGAEPLICDVASMRGHSLESDLRSRDFTINAMAYAVHSERHVDLIDIAGGQADLKARLVRRVSQTGLAEDPIRMLRAVRLASALDMAIERETRNQIERIADTIRLASPERMRDELWKMLATSRPDKAIDDAEQLGLLRTILPEVTAMMGVAQSPPHHLDVYQHTLATMRYAAEIRRWLCAEQGEARPTSEPETEWQAALRSWRAPLRRHFMQTTAGGRLHADWLLWHALLHDIGKPETQTKDPLSQPKVRKEIEGQTEETAGAERGVRLRFFEHESVGATMAAVRLALLRFSRQEIVLSRNVIEAHMRPHHLHASFADTPISNRALYRFVRDVGGQKGEATAIDTAMLALADVQATHEGAPPSWTRYLDHIAQIVGYVFDDKGQQDVRRRPLLDGHTLMAHLDLKPGRAVGTLMGKLMEAQAAGDVETVDEALSLASDLWEEMEE
jgi:poly(A) polymerase